MNQSSYSKDLSPRSNGSGGSRNVSRPSTRNGGGRLPNKTAGGSTINRSEAASKIQSRPKGSGSTLPSLAEGKRPSGGTRGDKGNFPNIAGKAKAGETWQARAKER